MAIRTPEAVATALLALAVALTGCTPTIGSLGTASADSTAVASRNGVSVGSTVPGSVTSYLTAVRAGNLQAVLALTDPEKYPAGADTADNVYRYLGTGIIRLQTWEFVGTRAIDGGGEWAFVVCQVLFEDGWRSEVPLTFKLDGHGEIMFVG